MGWLENFGMFARQLPEDELFTKDVVLGCRVWYKSRRPDLDITLIRDALEGYAYKNDRQIKVECAFHSLDRSSPRCLIIVAPVAEAADVFHAIHDRDYGNPFSR